MLKNVYYKKAFCDSQNSTASFKIISNGSLLFGFDHHTNLAMNNFVAIFTFIYHYNNIFGLEKLNSVIYIEHLS